MSTNIGKEHEVRFKSYDQDQILLQPILIEKLIPSGHLVRIVDQFVESIPMDFLSSYYSGEGCPPYHPKMMLKVWLYGYCEQIYTSRRLAKSLREHLYFIWLSGHQMPCFKTLSAFRSSRMSDLLKGVFLQLLSYLSDSGYIDLEDFFVDGTKLAANVNKYKCVWRKNLDRYTGWLADRVEALWEKIEALNLSEDLRYGRKDLPEMGDGETIEIRLSSQALGEQIEALNEFLAQKAMQEQRSEEVKEGEKWSRHLSKEKEKLAKYEQQMALLDGRNSYCKTDTDATMMRMKNDETLPAYNLQASANHQFIVNISVHQQGSDSATFPPHLDQWQSYQDQLPQPQKQRIMGDAGYGSEENYARLEEEGIESYLKYAQWYQEISGQMDKKPFHPYHFTYDPERDTYQCPQGRTLYFVRESERKSINGYGRMIRVYEARSCQGCPVAEQCKTTPNPKTLSTSHKLRAYKDAVKEALDSPVGKALRKRRAYEIETFFGDLKHNRNYRRFLLRGLNKVLIEALLLATSYNLRKVSCIQSECWKKQYENRAVKKVNKSTKKAA